MSATESTLTLPRELDPIEAIAGLAAAVQLEWLEQQAIGLREKPLREIAPLLAFLRDEYSAETIVAEFTGSADLAASATLQKLLALAEAVNAEAELERQTEEDDDKSDEPVDETTAETEAARLELPLEHRIARFVPLLCAQIESLLAAWICTCMKRVAGQLERASDRRDLRDTIDRLLEEHRLLYSKRQRGGGNYDHTTPPSIRKLMIALADPQPGDELIDPCFGFGGLLTDSIDAIQSQAATTDSSSVPLCVRGADKNRQACLIGMARVLLSTGECMSLLVADHLRWPQNDSSFFIDHPQTIGRRCLLVAPPLGIDINPQEVEGAETLATESIYALILRAVCHLETENHFCKNEGQAVLLVPREALSSKGPMQRLRRFLLHHEFVKAVVHLPAGIFGPSSTLEISLLILHEWPHRRDTIAPSIKVSVCDATPFFKPVQQTQPRQITDEGIRGLQDALLDDGPDDVATNQLEIGDFASSDYSLIDTVYESKADFKKIFDSFGKWGEKQIPFHLPLGQLVNFGETSDFDKPLDYDPGGGWGILRSSDIADGALQQPKAWMSHEAMHDMHLAGHGDKTFLAPGDILIAWDDDSYHVIDLQEERFSTDKDWRLIPDKSIAVLIFPSIDPQSHDAVHRGIDGAITSGKSKIAFADDLVDRDYLLAYLRSRYVRDYLRGNPQALRKRLAELPIIIVGWNEQNQARWCATDDHPTDLIDFLVFSNKVPRKSDDYPANQFGLCELSKGTVKYCAARTNIACETLLGSPQIDLAAFWKLAKDLRHLALFLAKMCAGSSPISEESIKAWKIRKRTDPHWDYEPGISTPWLRIIKDWRKNWRAVRTDIQAYERITSWANDFSARCQSLQRAGTTENALLQYTLLEKVAAEARDELAINGTLNLLCANVARLTGRYIDFLMSDAEIQIDLLQTVHDHKQAAENADDEASPAEATFSIDQTIAVRNIGALPLETLAFHSDFEGPDKEQVQSTAIDLLEAGASKESRVHLQRSKQPLPDAYELRWSATMLNGKTIDGAIQVAILSEEDAGTPRSTPVDLGPLPYIAGKSIPLQYADVFFGREAELQNIRRAVETRGNVMLLEGNRRMGKSTIMNQLLANEAIPGWIGVLCTLQRVIRVPAGACIETNFYRHLGYEIARSVKNRWGSVPLPADTTMDKEFDATLRELIGDDDPFGDFCEYIDTILEKLKGEGKGLLLMIDEFDLAQSWLDQKIDIGQIPEKLRYLLQNRENLTAIMAGSIHLRQMRNQYWHPLFGIGRTISVSHLDEDASRQLITDPVQDKLNFTPDAVDLAYRQTAGQPFMLQTLCSTIFDQAAQSGVTAIGTDQIRNAICTLAGGNEHFDALWGYCQSDQQRYLLHLIYREGAGELLSLGRIQGAHVGYAASKLTEDIESLIELEVLQKRQSAGIMRYGLAIPMMGKWIEENHDYEMLTQKAAPKQPRHTLHDLLWRLLHDLGQLQHALEEEIEAIKARLVGNISATEKTALEKQLLELDEELDRAKYTEHDIHFKLESL